MKQILIIQILMVAIAGTGFGPVPELTAVTVASAATAEEHKVVLELKDGTTFRGEIRQVEPSVYVVQTPDEIAEITGAEMRKYLVTRTEGEIDEIIAQIERAAVTGERILRYETFEVITHNGDVDFWSHTQSRNESSKVLTYIQWGAKERELDRYRTMTAFDKYGNRLTSRIEPREGTDLYNVIVDLAVPVLPGEKVDLAMRYVNKGFAKKDGDTFHFTFSGDFPEDRIYHRKVVLPAGAKIKSVEPKPWLQFEHDGRTVIVWHRYYPKFQELPLTVTYELK